MRIAIVYDSRTGTTKAAAEMMAELRRLDPKPAQAFSHALAQPVTPDVLVRPDGSGGWAIELNAETLPRVLVDLGMFPVRMRSVSGAGPKVCFSFSSTRPRQPSSSSTR